MKFLSAFTLAAILLSPFLTSCATLRAGSPVKAGFEVEETSWAVKYIPGLKMLSKLVPPPTEARMKWDEYQKNRNRSWDTDQKIP